MGDCRGAGGGDGGRARRVRRECEDGGFDGDDSVLHLGVDVFDRAVPRLLRERGVVLLFEGGVADGEVLGENGFGNFGCEF